MVSSGVVADDFPATRRADISAAHLRAGSGFASPAAAEPGLQRKSGCTSSCGLIAHEQKNDSNACSHPRGRPRYTLLAAKPHANAQTIVEYRRQDFHAAADHSAAAAADTAEAYMDSHERGTGWRDSQ